MAFDPDEGRHAYSTTIGEDVYLTDDELEAFKRAAEGSHLSVEDFVVGLLTHEYERRALTKVGRKLAEWDGQPPLKEVDELVAEIGKLIEQAENPGPDTRNIHRKLRGICDLMQVEGDDSEDAVVRELERIQRLLPPVFDPDYGVPADFD